MTHPISDGFRPRLWTMTPAELAKELAAARQVAEALAAGMQSEINRQAERLRHPANINNPASEETS